MTSVPTAQFDSYWRQLKELRTNRPLMPERKMGELHSNNAYYTQNLDVPTSFSGASDLQISLPKIDEADNYDLDDEAHEKYIKVSDVSQMIEEKENEIVKAIGIGQMLLEKLNDVTSEKDQLVLSVETLKRQRDQMMSNISILTSNAEEMRAENNALKSTCKKIRQERNDCKNENVRLDTELQKLTTEIESLTKANIKLKEKMQELVAEVDDYKSDLHKANEEAHRAYMLANYTSPSNNKSVSKRVEDTDALSPRHSEYDEDEDIIADLQSEINSLQTAMKHLRDENKELQAVVFQNKSMHDQVTALESHIKYMQNADIENKDMLMKLRVEIQDLSEQNQILEEQNRRRPSNVSRIIKGSIMDELQTSMTADDDGQVDAPQPPNKPLNEESLCELDTKPKPNTSSDVQAHSGEVFVAYKRFAVKSETDKDVQVTVWRHPHGRDLFLDISENGRLLTVKCLRDIVDVDDEGQNRFSLAFKKHAQEQWIFGSNEKKGCINFFGQHMWCAGQLLPEL